MSDEPQPADNASQPASSEAPVPSPDEIPFRDPEQAEIELKISKDIN